MKILNLSTILLLCALFIGDCRADGIEDFLLADEEQEAAFAEEGVKADLIYYHKDWNKRDSAPIIQLILHTDKDLVGDYSSFKNLVSGKSESFKLLMLDSVFRKTIPNSRVTNYELLDEISALMVTLAYYESDGASVWTQYQLWAWSSESEADAKCVVASDVEERVEAYYDDSITAAMIDLLVQCSQLWPENSRRTES